jgi:hypothetical protein
MAERRKQIIENSRNNRDSDSSKTRKSDSTFEKNIALEEYRLQTQTNLTLPQISNIIKQLKDDRYRKQMQDPDLLDELGSFVDSRSRGQGTGVGSGSGSSQSLKFGGSPVVFFGDDQDSIVPSSVESQKSRKPLIFVGDAPDALPESSESSSSEDTRGFRSVPSIISRSTSSSGVGSTTDGGFSILTDRSSIKSKPIIPVGSIISSGSTSSGKTKANPYDPFNESEGSVSGRTVSDVDTSGASSKRKVNVIPIEERPAGRALPTIREKPLNKMKKSELQEVAKSLGLPTTQSGAKRGTTKQITNADLIESITAKMGR